MAEIIPFQIEWQPRLISLWQECDLARPWHDDNDQVRQHIAAPIAQIWLLVEGEQLIGAINLAMHVDQTGYIYYLAVRPDESIKGYGKQLMEYAQLQMREMGCSEAHLIVNHQKVKLIKYTESLA